MKFFKEKPNYFVSTSLDHFVKIWKNKEKVEIYSIKIDSEIVCCDVSPDDSWIAVGSTLGHIYLIDIAKGVIF